MIAASLPVINELVAFRMVFLEKPVGILTVVFSVFKHLFTAVCVLLSL